MNAIHVLVGIAGIGLPALGQVPAAQPLLHVTIAFDLTVHASYARTAPLFGPEGERAWAGNHWNPVFLYPTPAEDMEGAVFTVQHGPLKAVWVNTLLDMDARHFQYVYFLPDMMVTVIDVRFRPLAAEETEVHVVYTRTALTQDGNQHVTTMSEGDKTAGAEWQHAIDTYLAQSKTGAKP
jgi:hypothetical protein